LRGNKNQRLPKFDESTSWAVFWRQFETVAEHNNWTPCDKATYPIALIEPAAHILDVIPSGAMYEEFTSALKNHYGDHHLEEAFHAQLKRRTQRIVDLAAVIDHLALCPRQLT
jgi:hypothetical protein